MLRLMGIDLGLVRIATVVDNLGSQPFCYAGGPIIEINNLYNKKIAFLKKEQLRCNPRIIELQHKYDISSRSLTKDEWNEWRYLTRYTPKMQSITEYRNRRINLCYHKMSKEIVADASNKKIDVIVIGRNPDIKQNTRGRFGKDDTRQKFHFLPNYKFIDMMQYKAEIQNIVVMDIPEPYTSKASFKDNDVIPDRTKVKKKANGHSDIKFSGTRRYRGLYVASDGSLIQADVNAAYNILKKAFPDAFAEGMAKVSEIDTLRGCRSHPAVRKVF